MVPSDLPRIIGDLARRVAELERRDRNRSREGVVAEIDEAAGLARVRFNGDDGEPFLGPWMRTQALASGGVNIQAEPVVGQPVRVESQSGDLADGLISLSSFSDDNPRPHDKAGELAITKGGNALRITGAGVEITGPLTITGPSVTHNGVNIGDTHTHTHGDPAGTTSPPS